MKVFWDLDYKNCYSVDKTISVEQFLDQVKASYYDRMGIELLSTDVIVNLDSRGRWSLYVNNTRRLKNENSNGRDNYQRCKINSNRKGVEREK
jgi:hypothetical protein